MRENMLLDAKTKVQNSLASVQSDQPLLIYIYSILQAFQRS